MGPHLDAVECIYSFIAEVKRVANVLTSYSSSSHNLTSRSLHQASASFVCILENAAWNLLFTASLKSFVYHVVFEFRVQLLEIHECLLKGVDHESNFF